jgi:hypothetical protein
MTQAPEGPPRWGGADGPEVVYLGGEQFSGSATGPNPQVKFRDPRADAAALCFCGIDPGLTGGVAFYFPCAPDRVAAEDMPAAGGEVDCATLARRIAQMAPSLAVVERVGAMPGQGVSSTFKFGQSYGAVLGVMAALRIPTHVVSPAVWPRGTGSAKANGALTAEAALAA